MSKDEQWNEVSGDFLVMLGSYLRRGGRGGGLVMDSQKSKDPMK